MLYVFIVFDDAFSISDQKKIIGWKEDASKRLWPNLRYYAGIFLEIINNTAMNLSHDGRSPRRDLNLRPANTVEC